MKILVVDRDPVSANLVKSKLEPLGHNVEVQAGKTEVLDMVSQRGWDVVFLDPSPLTNAKPLVMNIRRNVRRAVYMILSSETLNEQEALLSGFNDFISKPINPSELDTKIQAAAQLNGILRHLANEAEDYPSAGGVIAKSAFGQLFLSCMDRADRYGEIAYVVFISFENFASISANNGAYEAEVVSAKLAQHLVRLRRQSDIIAQIHANEYALLLLRTLSDTEPLDATGRFADSLSKCFDLPSSPSMDIELKVSLMKLPAGSLVAEYHLSVRQS